MAKKSAPAAKPAKKRPSAIYMNAGLDGEHSQRMDVHLHQAYKFFGELYAKDKAVNGHLPPSPLTGQWIGFGANVGLFEYLVKMLSPKAQAEFRKRFKAKQLSY